MEKNFTQNKHVIIKAVTANGQTKLFYGLQKRSVREQAKVHLSKIMPLDEWLSGRSKPSEADIESFRKIVAHSQRIASEGYIEKVIINTKDGSNRIAKEYRRL